MGHAIQRERYYDLWKYPIPCSRRGQLKSHTASASFWCHTRGGSRSTVVQVRSWPCRTTGFKIGWWQTSLVWLPCGLRQPEFSDLQKGRQKIRRRQWGNAWTALLQLRHLLLEIVLQKMRFVIFTNSSHSGFVSLHTLTGIYDALCSVIRYSSTGKLLHRMHECKSIEFFSWNQTMLPLF